MHLKIGNITSLQDARYSAALGFNLISFSLERGSTKKLPLASVWSMVQWLDGPGVVLELNTDSLDELQELSFEPRYLSFPLQEYHDALWNYSPALILRCNAEDDPAHLRALLEAATAAGHELKFEISVPAPEALEGFRDLLTQLFVNFPSLEMADQFIRSAAAKPYGISFPEEAEEEPNLLNYEVLDEVMAVYSDVHL